MSERSLAVLAATRARQSEAARLRRERETPIFIGRLRTPRIIIVRNAEIPGFAAIDAEAAPTNIYLWRAGNMLKIGLTDNVAARLARLQTGCPIAETEVVTFPGPYHLEGMLQERFAGLHSHGEWFHFRDVLSALYFELRRKGEPFERPRSRRGDNRRRVVPPA